MLSEEQKLRQELAVVWGMHDNLKSACAERDARIAELEAANEAFGKRQEWWNTRMLELEQQLAEARKDAMSAAALICDALPAPPSCNVLERSLWDVATVAAADAIRAAIKEQT